MNNAVAVPGIDGRQVVQSSVVERWLASLDVSADTKTTYRTSLRKYATWMQENPAAEVSPIVIREWRDSIEGAPSTVNVRLAAVRNFYRWLVEQGMMTTNPAAGVRGSLRRGANKAHKRDELTTDEVLAVFATCDDTVGGRRDLAIISLMAYCALRTIEVYNADIEDLATKDGRQVLWVAGKGSGGEKDTFVVLPAPAEQAVRGWLVKRPGEAVGPLFISLARGSKAQRLSRASIRAMVSRRFREAGITGRRKTTHSLRHSAISNAIRNGATVLQAQAMARHASPTTTMIYYHELERTAKPAEDLIRYREEGN